MSNDMEKYLPNIVRLQDELLCIPISFLLGSKTFTLKIMERKLKTKVK